MGSFVHKNFLAQYIIVRSGLSEMGDGNKLPSIRTHKKKHFYNIGVAETIFFFMVDQHRGLKTVRKIFVKVIIIYSKTPDRTIQFAVDSYLLCLGLRKNSQEDKGEQ